MSEEAVRGSTRGEAALAMDGATLLLPNPWIVRFLLLLPLVGALACGGPSTGRFPMPAAAQVIFTQDATCPPDHVIVEPRPDVPPHTLLAHRGGNPPAAVAADPERLGLWFAQHGEDPAAIDTTWRTFEIKGCGEDVMYVCRHPSVEDFDAHEGRIVGDGTLRRGGEVQSAVRCQSNVWRQLHDQAGPRGDIAARMEAPNVPRLPLHSSTPTLPARLKNLRVLATEHPHTGVTQASCHALGRKFARDIGWAPVEAGQAYDIAVQFDCFNVAFVTHRDQMFALSPQDLQVTLTFSAPDGKFIDQFPPFPSTMSCPVNDELQCNAAFGEFVNATLAMGINQSAKLLDYVTKHRATR